MDEDRMDEDPADSSLEIEGSALHAAAGPGRAWRRAALACAALLLVTLFLLASIPAVRGSVRSLAGSLAARPTPTAPPGTSARADPNPAPTTPRDVPALGAAPTNCPPTPPSRTETPFFGAGVGVSPVWVVGFDQPYATKRLTGVSTSYTPRGWTALVIWAIEPGYKGRVTIHGGGLRDGRPIWLSVGLRQDPALSATLDPAGVDLDLQSENWNEWFGALYLPTAGCYFLEADWPNGSWRVSFAAGE